MKLLGTLISTFGLAAKRIWNHRVLMLCLLAGLVVAVGLLSSIPMYADSVHHRLLQGELSEEGIQRPPFAFLWHYVGTWHGDLAWDDYAPADEYLSNRLPGILELPQDVLVRYVKTSNLRLFAEADSEVFGDRDPLLWTNLGFVTGLEDRVDLVEGSFPSSDRGERVGVLVNQTLAEQVGLQVGEEYVLFAGDSEKRIPVYIAGIWRPRDVLDPYWFYQPAAFEDILLTSEDRFARLVAPALEEPVSLAVWYQIFDGSRVRSSDVPTLLAQISRAEARTAALLPNAELYVSPMESLARYRQAARLLTIILGAFSIPLVGLVLYFVALIAGMVVRHSQAEIAVLRSRGTTRVQILFVYLLEGLLIGSAGLIGGLYLGRWLAQLMGRSRTFLDPALLAGPADTHLPVALSTTALWYGLLAVGLAVLALLIPALAASRHTIVTFKWERARALLRPFWQRYYLDLLLVALPLYGWYLLRQQGTIATMATGQDPLSNPVLFLVPALFCFSLALLFIRFFPLLMRALSWLVGWLPGTTLLLTFRQLARSTAQYTGPLLLLSLTLSLATFTASMAVTLDAHLADQAYYQAGADLKLAEMGQSTEEPEGQELPGQSLPSASAGAEEEGPRWLFLPIGSHLEIPGVQAAARVGNYGVTSNIGGRQDPGQILGVDRIDFAHVAFYRTDFGGGEALAGLMNRLAAARNNILIDRGFMARHTLAMGDPIRLTVGVAGVYQEIEFVIAGVLDMFPTLYPQDGPFFVANLDYVHERLGGTFPYDVWLSTDPDTVGSEIASGVRGLGISVLAIADAREMIAMEQTRPERQGLFGLLSVGFLSAALLTVLGFLVYAVVSFQRRFIELGMLRAVGLSVWQMTGYLAGEQALLVLVGGGLGTALGLLASMLFIPYLQVGAGKEAMVPPFVVQIAWNELWVIYAVFGMMFFLAVAVLIVLLARMKIFEAIKMGEVG